MKNKRRRTTYRVQIINPLTRVVETCVEIKAVSYSIKDGVLIFLNEATKKVAWIAATCWRVLKEPQPELATREEDPDRYYNDLSQG